MIFFRGFFVQCLIGLVCLTGMLSAAASDESELLDRIGRQIGHSPVVRASFNQTKQMAALKRPLVTDGRLVLSANYGILWQIERPYRMTYVLGSERLVEIDQNGARRIRGAREVPVLAQVDRIFRAMLGANFEVLREYFEVTVRGEATHWTIDLKPRQMQLAKHLGEVQISGGSFVEEIRMSEEGGGTLIRFSKPQSAAALNDAELSLFGSDKDNVGVSR